MPREKLSRWGAAALSDVELLMILLRTGTKGHDVRAAARDLLRIVDNCGLNLQLDDMVARDASGKVDSRVPGVGAVKAITVAAAFEFVRRRVPSRGIRVSKPTDVYQLIRHYGTRSQEYFLCVSLNGANEVVNIEVVTIGLLNSTQVHPREVFCRAIENRAAAVVVAHNHPSGQLQPSREDVLVTKRLRDAGEIIGIRVLDHLIISEVGYYSMNEGGDF